MTGIIFSGLAAALVLAVWFVGGLLQKRDVFSDHQHCEVVISGNRVMVFSEDRIIYEYWLGRGDPPPTLAMILKQQFKSSEGDPITVSKVVRNGVVEWEW